MPAFIDRTGNKYGRLKVIALDIEKSTKKRKYWICSCECGNQTSVNADCLTRGSTKSCGCLKVENQLIQAAKRKKWGKKLLPTRHIWQLMLRRCYNPKDKVFIHYGKRGITVCKRWHNFDNFLKDMGVKPTGLSLERKNVHENYSPENCCWASQVEQSRNKTTTKWITINGQIKSASEWCEIYNCSQGLFSARVKRGWDPLKALTTPARLVSQAWRKKEKF